MAHAIVPMLRFTRAHPLVVFFVLAFALTWLIEIPLVLASWGLITFPTSVPLLILMGYGPTIAAVITSAAVGGWAEVRNLLKRLLIWRVGLGWWAVTIFLTGGIILGALGLYALSGNTVPPFPTLEPGLLLNVVLTFVVVSLVNGEEIGWRGFALPRLQSRYGIPMTVIVLGIIETLFHLPIFFNNGASDAGGQNGTPFLAFFASSVVAVFLYVWVYDHTRGSLLIATVLHGSMNAWASILPFPATSPTFFWLLTVVQLVVVGVVILVGGTRWMQLASGTRQVFARPATPGVSAGTW